MQLDLTHAEDPSNTGKKRWEQEGHLLSVLENIRTVYEEGRFQGLRTAPIVVDADVC